MDRDKPIEIDCIIERMEVSCKSSPSLKRLLDKDDPDRLTIAGLLQFHVSDKDFTIRFLAPGRSSAKVLILVEAGLHSSVIKFGREKLIESEEGAYNRAVHRKMDNDIHPLLQDTIGQVEVNGLKFKSLAYNWAATSRLLIEPLANFLTEQEVSAKEVYSLLAAFSHHLLRWQKPSHSSYLPNEMFVWNEGGRNRILHVLQGDSNIIADSEMASLRAILNNDLPWSEFLGDAKCSQADRTHGDLNLSNVVMGRSARYSRPYIVDFASCQLRSDLEAVGKTPFCAARDWARLYRDICIFISDEQTDDHSKFARCLKVLDYYAVARVLDAEDCRQYPWLLKVATALSTIEDSYVAYMHSASDIPKLEFRHHCLCWKLVYLATAQYDAMHDVRKRAIIDSILHSLADVERIAKQPPDTPSVFIPRPNLGIDPAQGHRSPPVARLLPFFFLLLIIVIAGAAYTLLMPECLPLANVKISANLGHLFERIRSIAPSSPDLSDLYSETSVYWMSDSRFDSLVQTAGRTSALEDFRDEPIVVRFADGYHPHHTVAEFAANGEWRSIVLSVNPSKPNSNATLSEFQSRAGVFASTLFPPGGDPRSGLLVEPNKCHFNYDCTFLWQVPSRPQDQGPDRLISVRLINGEIASANIELDRASFLAKAPATNEDSNLPGTFHRATIMGALIVCLILFLVGRLFRRFSVAAFVAGSVISVAICLAVSTFLLPVETMFWRPANAPYLLMSVLSFVLGYICFSVVAARIKIGYYPGQYMFGKDRALSDNDWMAILCVLEGLAIAMVTAAAYLSALLIAEQYQVSGPVLGDALHSDLKYSLFYPSALSLIAAILATAWSSFLASWKRLPPLLTRVFGGCSLAIGFWALPGTIFYNYWLTLSVAAIEGFFMVWIIQRKGAMTLFCACLFIPELLVAIPTVLAMHGASIWAYLNLAPLFVPLGLIAVVRVSRLRQARPHLLAEATTR